jgi:sphinganine-1-phosphate aldolase
MSVDTHKYGYSTKGTSVVLFKNEELRKHMYFVQPDWPGGMYCSPTMAGSRSGGVIACCWASLVAIGQDGFLAKSKAIFETAQKIKNGYLELL